MWRSSAKKSANPSAAQICASKSIRYFKRQPVLIAPILGVCGVIKRKFHSSKISECRNLSSDLNIPLNDRSPLNLSFGKLARFADGSCVASIGGTSVLVTAVSKKVASDTSNAAPASFLPLTVDYRQKAAAAGRIPTNHLRRELGPTDHEILTGRVIDRSIRPLFPKGYGAETQIVCNLLSTDGMNDPSVLALNGASAALALSDIPWEGPIGAARIGYSNTVSKGSDGFILNPTRKELKKIAEEKGKSLNLVVSGTRDGKVVMLEADSTCLDPKLFLDGIEFGLQSTSSIARFIDSQAKSKNVVKRLNPFVNMKNNGFSDENKESEYPLFRAYSLIELMCEQKLRLIYEDRRHDKISRDLAAFAVRDEAIAQLRTSSDIDPSFYYDAFNQLSRNMVASIALDKGIRVDGRGIDEVRPIACHVNTHNPLHGSAIFQRGQTQVFCTVALDSLESTALKVDPVSALMGNLKEKNFFLHYEFPPYATNEIGRAGAASGRRELGHGALAEKALKAVVPKDHPFTIRLTSEVLESNGSSSMASVCGGSLALLDAGVPLDSPAAGVAMGLMSRKTTKSSQNNDKSSVDADDRDYVVLTDILGMEDYLGDMDFKVAGTRHGITALQADIKLSGIPFHVVQTAMSKGHSAINKILDIMENSREDGNYPRKSKPNWPITEKINVPAHKRGRFLGPGGINIKKILAETGVQITPESGTEASTTWTMFAPNAEALVEASEIIESILMQEKVPELEFGSIYPSIIKEIREKGVMVELHPELPLVFVTNSQLDAKKVSHPSALGLVVDQEMLVKYYGRDPVSGTMRVSRKELVVGSAKAVKQLKRGVKSESKLLSKKGQEIQSLKNEDSSLNHYTSKSIISETEAPLNKPSQTFGIGSHSITWKEKIASYLEPTKESKLDEKLEKRARFEIAPVAATKTLPSLIPELWLPKAADKNSLESCEARSNNRAELQNFSNGSSTQAYQTSKIFNEQYKKEASKA